MLKVSTAWLFKAGEYQKSGEPLLVMDSVRENEELGVETTQGFENMQMTFVPSVNSANGNKIKKTRRSGGKHQMAACCFCKKRRKKCDGGYPSCSNCTSANVLCTIIEPVTGREISRNYMEILEGKIDSLQGELSIAKKNGYTPSADSVVLNNENEIESQEREKDGGRLRSVDKDLATEVGYITLTAGAEPRFLGPSSAYSIAKVIHHSIHYYKQERGENLANGSDFSSDGSRNNDQIVTEPVFVKPSLEVAQRLMKAYLHGVQLQYPFLEWTWVQECFEEVMNNDSENTISLFFIYMIFAVGSQLLESSTGLSSAAYTKSYYNKAFEYITPIVEDITIKTVQVYLLLSVFSQKMPYGSSIWQTTGLAIRTSVVLGLHRESYGQCRRKSSFAQTKDSDIRLRVFWSAYSMERINGLILGRPFSIADIDIDVPLPETDEYVVATHVFKLRRIQSTICAFVYKPEKYMENEEDIDATRHQIMLELNSWKSTFPSKSDANSTWETDNWCTISYHNSVLLLLRPVLLKIAELKESSPTHLIAWFREFTQSASAICLNYKELHSKMKLSYTWLAIHCIYTTGLAFLYCIWLDCQFRFLEWRRKSIIYDTISACSNILYVLAERWENAKVFRNSYEKMSRSVLERLEGTDDQDSHGSSNETSNLKERAINAFTPGIKNINGPYHREALDYQLNSHLSSRNKRLISTDGMSFIAPLSNSGSSTPSVNDSTSFTNAAKLNSNSLKDFFQNIGDPFLHDILYDMDQFLS